MPKPTAHELGLEPNAPSGDSPNPGNQNPAADAKRMPGDDARPDDAGPAASVLSGTVRVTALRTFYANGTFLVEPGKSVDLPAAAAQVHIDLEEARLADDAA